MNGESAAAPFAGLVADPAVAFGVLLIRALVDSLGCFLGGVWFGGDLAASTAGAFAFALAVAGTFPLPAALVEAELFAVFLTPAAWPDLAFARGFAVAVEVLFAAAFFAVLVVAAVFPAFADAPLRAPVFAAVAFTALDLAVAALAAALLAAAPARDLVGVLVPFGAAIFSPCC